ncbi:MAG TPA: pyridoxal 5'-phosphate synthase glutaminase subunit PdxT [Myxococcales bacterium]|nr:pyridoxal 5'-phosphate synthase glutaminase subunit PdxT [Myxococcales bacterium]
MKVGVLALQGGYAAHVKTLEVLGHQCALIRTAAGLDEIDGLVLPGGESTTHLKLIKRWNLSDGLNDFVQSGKPILATCAGLILAARAVSDPEQYSFGWLDIQLTRNGWGRQLDSFEAVADDGVTPLMFIRAPRITQMGPAVEVLMRFRDEPIMVRQGSFVGATFHPELSANLSVHAALFGDLRTSVQSQ